MAEDYDVVVIGGGPGGYVAAIRAAQLGLKTACVEQGASLGGTCLNVGCIPSKALLQSSELYSTITHKAKDHGILTTGVQVDLTAMLDRKTKIVKGLTVGIEGLFKKNKITWLKGIGSFAGPSRVKITSKDGAASEVGAKNIIIATGSTPVELRIAPFDGKAVVSSTEALSFTSVPKTMVVIGGGVIGLELGSVWGRLGSKVAVVEARERVLPPMDESLSKEMQKILEKQGFNFHLNTKVSAVQATGAGAIVRAECAGKPVELQADVVLVAVGRRPYTTGLNLEAAGIAARPDGKVEVDRHFRTKLPNVYAIGDVIDGPMLAHKAEDEGIAVAEIISGRAGHVNYDAIPSVVYTWPEVAAVGLAEFEAKAKGIQYSVGTFPFLANGRARCLGETDGFIKVMADAKTDRIIGVHMIGPSVSELIAEAAVAVEFSASAEDLARSVHAHPTLAEAMKEACLGVAKRTIHL